MKEEAGRTPRVGCHVVVKVAHHNEFMVRLEKIVQQAFQILLKAMPWGFMLRSSRSRGDDAGLLCVNCFRTSSRCVNWLTDLDDRDLGGTRALQGNANPTTHVGGILCRG